MDMDDDWVDDIDIEIEEENFPATEILIEEHKLIKKGLEMLEKAVMSGVSDSKVYEQLVEFFSGYADRIHHGKEEEILFRDLKKNSPTHIVEMVNTLESDHITGRDLVSKIRENAGNISSLKDYALSYVTFLRDHILKEDEGLFPSMHPYLSREKEENMIPEFKKVDTERNKDYYESIIRKLEDRISN